MTSKGNRRAAFHIWWMRYPSMARVTQDVCKSPIKQPQIWFKVTTLDNGSSRNAYVHVIRKRAYEWKPVLHLCRLFKQLLFQRHMFLTHPCHAKDESGTWTSPHHRWQISTWTHPGLIHSQSKLREACRCVIKQRGAGWVSLWAAVWSRALPKSMKHLY